MSEKEEDKREDEDSAPKSESEPPPKSEPPPAEQRRSAAPASAAAPATGPRPGYAFLAIASIVALVMDLGTKEWAVKALADAPRTGMPIIEGIQIGGSTYKLHFDLAQNRGGAWGVLGDQPDYVRLPFFFLVSALAVVFIISLYKKLEPRQRALKWALPLVMGGAFGNLIDRIRHQHVIDFIDAFVVTGGKATHWPTFNVADIWIVAGVILMAIDMFSPSKPVPAKAEAGKGEPAAEG